MISIIIPTWNEEECLPKLLECIKKQSYKDYEIIVADANSKDKTVTIAKKHGCKIVKSGSLPGVGRNNGAKIAKGDILVFLDADVLLDNNFLKNAVKEFEKRKLDCASVKIVPQGNKFIDRLFLGAFNSWVIATQTFYPHAIGACIICRKELHNKIKGFDEKIAVAEDMEYVKRCAKYGKFRILKNSKVYFSMRRYESHGHLNVAAKIVLGEIHRMFAGELRKDVFNYQVRYRK
ncbi:MAG TPA: glycosyltransferase [Candidatus Nanoarchaeia archaeon]|nr:glycosyltransferase [Candidatus Nanoarchaeia archaeon]